jgi:hypothetical protein
MSQILTIYEGEWDLFIQLRLLITAKEGLASSGMSNSEESISPG